MKNLIIAITLLASTSLYAETDYTQPCKIMGSLGEIAMLMRQSGIPLSTALSGLEKNTLESVYIERAYSFSVKVSKFDQQREIDEFKEYAYKVCLETGEDFNRRGVKGLK
jgi:hypothetical protein